MSLRRVRRVGEDNDDMRALARIQCQPAREPACGRGDRGRSGSQPFEDRRGADAPPGTSRPEPSITQIAPLVQRRSYQAAACRAHRMASAWRRIGDRFSTDRRRARPREHRGANASLISKGRCPRRSSRLLQVAAVGEAVDVVMRIDRRHLRQRRRGPRGLPSTPVHVHPQCGRLQPDLAVVRRCRSVGPHRLPDRPAALRSCDADLVTRDHATPASRLAVSWQAPDRRDLPIEPSFLHRAERAVGHQSDASASSRVNPNFRAIRSAASQGSGKSYGKSTGLTRPGPC